MSRRNTSGPVITLIDKLAASLMNKCKRLLPNARTDLTKIPLVESCLIRYGHTNCRVFFNFNNVPGRLHYKFELTVDDNNYHPMISRFLSRLMSEEYAKNQHGLFPLGIKKTELDKKVIYAVRGFHTLLNTVSSASLNLKGTVDLYSVKELRILMELLIHVSVAVEISTKLESGDYNIGDLDDDKQKTLDIYKSIAFGRFFNEDIKIGHVFNALIDSISNMPFNIVFPSVSLNRTYLNPNLDYDTRVCVLMVLFKIKIAMDQLDVVLKESSKESYNFIKSDKSNGSDKSDKPDYNLIEFIKHNAFLVDDYRINNDLDQDRLFKDALMPLLKELKTTDELLCEAYQTELIDLFKYRENHPNSENIAYDAWRLIEFNNHTAHPNRELGDQNFISSFTALAVFHRLPQELQKEPLFKIFRDTVTSKDIIDPYLDKQNKGPLYKFG
jgi:hypothetical protein